MLLSVPKRKVCLALTMLMALAVAAPMRAEAFPSILVDVDTGRVLEHEQAFKRWYPASLTKLMLMYVVFEKLESGELKRDTPVVMSAHAVNEPAAKMYLKPGATMSLDTAMKIIMVKSANDVAVGIAESVSGTQAAFVAQMNAAAARIGMTSSHFVNPNGLPEPGQYSTVRDMAVLAVRLRRQFPQYASYFDLAGVRFGQKTIPNYNYLIGRFRGADGMKTGFICAAGFNQVSTATRGRRTLLSVVFGTESLSARAEQSAKLLHAGFASQLKGGQTLSTLKAYGDDRKEVADLSDTMCTPKAHQARVSLRDKDGNLIVESPYIGKMAQASNVADVALISSGGYMPVDIARVPLPTFRPRHGPEPSVANAYAQSRREQNIPVPMIRPGDTAQARQ